ncbi:HupE/UreJ family protein [Coleofasciculus sp. FACHB-SPT9]|uniref:HupE/UreJ family protein n=1 Tax=Cyanophyceae TaxID=3028117 RepID=UPI00168815DC|nr:HupE/UreJ family protein [Coleofasciculus sp. FACHB-SPT9]MBD1890189.1 HupE/UreJ family protein [Coleofasciculus sp. FACHB-SPT9]
MSKDRRFAFLNLMQSRTVIVFLVLISTFLCAQQAIAHHPMGGKPPSNLFEGFFSGLAHPLIGLDHFAFVVAIGLLAVGQVRGAFIPAGFVLAALAGTGIHLLNLDLPASEIAIAGSVIVFGALLLTPNKPNWMVLIALGALAGLFHGYAYGEAIVGAGMTPLVAYLLGFTFIQYGVALVAMLIGNAVSRKSATQPLSWQRFAGLVICSIGVVFLSNSVLG